MLKAFLSFVRKEFLHIFRDGRTMLILLVMPILMILLFGYAITTEVRNTRVAVFVPHPTPKIDALLLRLDQNPRFTLALRARHPEEMDRAFRCGDIDAALVLNADCAVPLRPDAAPAVQVLLDGSEPNQASMRLNYLQGLLQSAADGARVAPVRLTARMLYNPQQRSEFNFVPGVLGMILTLICAMMAAVSIVREKETGSMEVLLVSPLSPWVVMVAKLVPFFVLSCFDLATLLLLSTLLIGVPIAGSVGVFLSVSLLYILTALALGLLISTLARTQLVAMMVSLLLILPTLYLSGMVFPIDSMPDVLQGMSLFVPARWYIEAARKLMIQGVTPDHVVHEAGILLVMLGGILTIALRNYKLRLE